MNLQVLEDLCNELLQSEDERSPTLSAMSAADLQTLYVDVLHQFGLELIIGLDAHSHWLSDLLVIVANQRPIHAAETVFYAVLVELDRRGVDEPDVA